MREASELPATSIVDIDPEDPTQLLDDAGQFGIVDIGLDREAMPHAEADAELDAAVAISAGETGYIEGGLDDDESDVDDDASELDTPETTTADAYADSADDTGDLYGVHVPKAADPDLDLTQDRESFQDSALGEHVFETLEKKYAENGTENPEEDVEFEDDSDPHGGHSKSDRRDTPVADKGSGGPGGL